MRTAPLEKTVQAACVRLLRSVGAEVFTIGRPPRRDSQHKGTGQTAGLCDVLAFLPAGSDRYDRELLALEVKRPGGDPVKKLRPEQRVFRDLCQRAAVLHVVGGVDELLALLQARGLVKEVPWYRKAG